MYTKPNHNKLARYALWLVSLVIFVCSSQNIGFGEACALKHDTDSLPYTATLGKSQQNQSAANAAENPTLTNTCSLTDHLLQIHQQQLEHAIISVILIILTFILYAGPSLITPVLTEPIPPTRRRHLTLCVFRE